MAWPAHLSVSFNTHLRKNRSGPFDTCHISGSGDGTILGVFFGEIYAELDPLGIEIHADRRRGSFMASPDVSNPGVFRIIESSPAGLLKIVSGFPNLIGKRTLIRRNQVMDMLGQGRHMFPHLIEVGFEYGVRFVIQNPPTPKSFEITGKKPVHRDPLGGYTASLDCHRLD